MYACGHVVHDRDSWMIPILSFMPSVVFYLCKWYEIIWAASWQNQYNDPAPSEDSDQLCTQWVVKDPSFLHANAHADLSFRWAHMPFCWFCHEAANFQFQDVLLIVLYF